MPALAADEVNRISAKDVRKQVAAKLQRPKKSIKQDVNYAIDKHLERGGWGNKERDDAAAPAAAQPGAHGLSAAAISKGRGRSESVCGIRFI